jgi:hypothetical protein
MISLIRDLRAAEAWRTRIAPIDESQLWVLELSIARLLVRAKRLANAW